MQDQQNDVTSVDVALAHLEAEQEFHLDDNFAGFAEAINKNFQDNLLKFGRNPLQVFHPLSNALWGTYIDSFDEEIRQHYNCRACREFIARFAQLVFIDENGEPVSACWNSTDGVPEHFHKTVEAMNAAVIGMIKFAALTPFYRVGEFMGRQEAGGFNHLYLKNTLTQYEGDTEASVIGGWYSIHPAISALFRENKLHDGAILRQTLKLMTSGELKRSDKHAAMVEAMYKAYQVFAKIKNPIQADHYLVSVISSYSPHFFAVSNSSALGRIFELVSSGADFSDIEHAWNQMLDPETYMRPTEDANAGNIEAAEKLIEKLGLEKSLDRRVVSSLAEILPHAYWAPESKQEEEKPAGIFSKLQPKKTNSDCDIGEIVGSAVDISWRKFSEEILPKTTKLRVLIAPRMALGSAVVMGATNEGCKPIMRYGNENNHYSWAVIANNVNGSVRPHSPETLGVTTGLIEVSCITKLPVSWNGSTGLLGFNEMSLIFLKDHTTRTNHLGLFPELVRSELFQVRSTIEQYSGETEPSCTEGPMALGISPTFFQYILEATTDLGVTKYHIRTWD